MVGIIISDGQMCRILCGIVIGDKGIGKRENGHGLMDCGGVKHRGVST